LNDEIGGQCRKKCDGIGRYQKQAQNTQNHSTTLKIFQMNFTARFLFLVFFSFGAFLEAADLSGKIIVLDAGHATKDSGENIINSGAKSKSGKLLERDITLAVAILMKPLLEAHGAKVYLTRTALNPWRYHETPSADNRARALFPNENNNW
jgi:N-acetylmuramoyl-L-alanine amidase